MDEIIRIARTVAETEIANSKRPHHKFRNRYAHTLRVLKWAERIQLAEGGDLTVITLAALFHDVGWDEITPHQKVSYQIVKEFFSSQGTDAEIADRVCNAVLLHNQRHIPRQELRTEERVLMDADALDETGMLSLAWDSLATGAEDDSAGYAVVYDRVMKFMKKRNMTGQMFKTDTGALFYEGRLEVLRTAMAEFKYELGI